MCENFKVSNFPQEQMIISSENSSVQNAFCSGGFQTANKLAESSKSFVLQFI